MVAALRYARGDGPLPYAVRALRLIEHFGARAVMGRDVLGYFEMTAMLAGASVIEAYQSREAARARGIDSLEWSAGAPHLADVLDEAESAQT